MKPNKNILGKILRSGGAFIILVIFVFYFIFRDMDVEKIIETISNINGFYVVIAIASMCIFILCEAINIKRIIKVLGYKLSILKCINYSVNGFFFSSITPSASGGQPMQVYNMSRDKIKIAHSSLVLIIELLFFQIVTLAYSVIGFIAQYEILEDSVNSIKLLFTLGVGINVIVVSLLIVAMFSSSTINKIVNLVTKILVLFRCTQVDAIIEKIDFIIEEYRGCAKFIATNKQLMMKTFLTTCVQIFSFHSIPYWVYRSFGLNEHSIFVFIGIQSVLFIAVSTIPLPGAVGVSESGFLVLFKILFPVPILGEAMLISRGISFYLFLLLSGIFLVMAWFIKYKSHNKTERVFI